MKRILILAIRAYQALSRSMPASPLLLGGVAGCRSWPTCSEYAVEAIRRDGALKGSLSAIVRVARCNPLWPVVHHG